MRCFERGGREGEVTVGRGVPSEIERRTQAREFSIGVGEERRVAGDTPTFGLKGLEIIEHGRGGGDPLVGDDLG